MRRELNHRSFKTYKGFARGYLAFYFLKYQIADLVPNPNSGVPSDSGPALAAQLGGDTTADASAA